MSSSEHEYERLVALRVETANERDEAIAEWRVECARRQALGEENARLREALEEISKQRTSDELDAEKRAMADYAYAYDRCVVRARATLSPPSASEQSEAPAISADELRAFIARDLVAQARAEEAEACAKIAEIDSHDVGAWGNPVRARRSIAAAIRARRVKVK